MKDLTRKSIHNSFQVVSSLSFSDPNVIQKKNDRMNTTNYLEFSKIVMYPVAANNFSSYSPMLFVHDYYPVHTAKAVQTWLKSKGYLVA